MGSAVFPCVDCHFGARQSEWAVSFAIPSSADNDSGKRARPHQLCLTSTTSAIVFHRLPSQAVSVDGKNGKVRAFPTGSRLRTGEDGRGLLERRHCYFFGQCFCLVAAVVTAESLRRPLSIIRFDKANAISSSLVLRPRRAA